MIWAIMWTVLLITAEILFLVWKNKEKRKKEDMSDEGWQ